MKPKNTAHDTRELENKDEKFSPALMKMAKRELEAFKTKSDESFINRIEMDRKLTSL